MVHEHYPHSDVPFALIAAAEQVRTLLADSGQHFGVGVLATTYPAETSSQSSSPQPLENVPLQGPEYFAPCYDNGDLIFVALPVSQNWRNALATDASGSRANVSFTVGSHPDPRVVDPRHRASKRRSRGDGWEKGRPRWRKGMPSKLRFVLFGQVELLPEKAGEISSEDNEATDCFLKWHPDAVHWAPGAEDSPHFARWAKMDVQKVYSIGGFGDEHFIGWIDAESYSRARPAAIEEDSDESSEDVEDVAPVDWAQMFKDTTGGDVVSTGAYADQGRQTHFERPT